MHSNPLPLSLSLSLLLEIHKIFLFLLYIKYYEKQRKVSNRDPFPCQSRAPRPRTTPLTRYPLLFEYYSRPNSQRRSDAFSRTRLCNTRRGANVLAAGKLQRFLANILLLPSPISRSLALPPRIRSKYFIRNDAKTVAIYV